MQVDDGGGGGGGELRVGLREDLAVSVSSLSHLRLQLHLAASLQLLFLDNFSPYVGSLPT